MRFWRKDVQREATVPTTGEAGHRVFRSVTRFSVFDPTWYGWKATLKRNSPSPEAYRATLWSAERLEPRFRVFEQHAASNNQALGDRHDFRALIQYSPELPERWIERLHAITRTYPAHRLVPVSSYTDPRDTVQDDLGVLDRDRHVAVIRVDDDDALATTFLDHVTPWLRPEYVGFGLSFFNGVACGMHEDGRLHTFRRYDTALASMGQTLLGVLPAGERELVGIGVHENHTRLPMQVPVLLVGGEALFLNVRHTGQDSLLDLETSEREAMVRRRLRKLKPFDDDAELLVGFPTLADGLTPPG